PSRSKSITDRIDHGDLSEKPGWVRFSFHPSTTMADIDHAINAVAECVANVKAWQRDYVYSSLTNEYAHKDGDTALRERVQEWFAL
ncbi:MAG: selenocysteine lyase, partial [Gemmatimonas sp.]|nr:selenocysteine lyase [Gemmatimonas sp.]